MIRRVSLFVYVIIHCNVLIIIRLLVFIIGKLCSRLSRVDSKRTVSYSASDKVGINLHNDNGIHYPGVRFIYTNTYVTKTYNFLPKEHSVTKVTLQSGLSDLEGSSPAFNKHKRCRNAKGANHVQLIMCQFFLCCMNFFANRRFH